MSTRNGTFCHLQTCTFLNIAWLICHLHDLHRILVWICDSGSLWDVLMVLFTDEEDWWMFFHHPLIHHVPRKFAQAKGFLFFAFWREMSDAAEEVMNLWRSERPGAFDWIFVSNKRLLRNGNKPLNSSAVGRVSQMNVPCGVLINGSIFVIQSVFSYSSSLSWCIIWFDFTLTR